MYRNQLNVEWDQFKEEVKMRWDALNDEDLDAIENDVQQLADYVEKRYGVSKSEAEKEVAEFNKGWVNRSFQ